MNWDRSSIQRLLDSAHVDGGWPYQDGSASSAEPTALACLALLYRGVQTEPVQKGLAWLAHQQQPDGGVAVRAGVAQPCWATALAVLAWHGAREVGSINYSAQQKAAVDWLLRNEGETFKPNPAIYGHNARLKGWSWIAGTHSWIEPTAYAILALRTAGLGDHPRTREGVSLLLDRAMSQGGWNYGNNIIFGTELRAFPAQTGMALAALAGEPRHDCVGRAIQYLCSELSRVRSPISLGWGLIGAGAWDARPESADSWLEECAERVGSKRPQPLFDALLLLADARNCPLIPTPKEITIGT